VTLEPGEDKMMPRLARNWAMIASPLSQSVLAELSRSFLTPWGVTGRSFAVPDRLKCQN
jgi:hypothetical protein